MSVYFLVEWAHIALICAYLSTDEDAYVFNISTQKMAAGK